MRLREDSSNWKASGLQRKLKMVPDEPIKRPAKKDKKRWCKGKVGVEHDYQWREKPWVGRLTVRLKACTKCGKKDWRSIIYPHRTNPVK